MKTVSAVMKPTPQILPAQHTDCFLFPDDPARRDRGSHSIMSSQNYNYKKHSHRESCRESPDRYKNSARATHSSSHRTKKIFDESPAASHVQNKSRRKRNFRQRSSSSNSSPCRRRRRRREKKSRRLSPETERSSQRKNELKRRSLLAGIEFIGKSLLSKKDENTSTVALTKSKSSLEAINKVLNSFSSNDLRDVVDDDVQEIIVEKRRGPGPTRNVESERSRDNPLVVQCQTPKTAIPEPEQPQQEKFTDGNFCFVHFSQSSSELEVTFQNRKLQTQHFYSKLEDGEDASDKIQTLLEQHSESAPTLVISSILQLEFLNLHHTLNLFSGWLDLRTLVINRNFSNINAIRCQREESEHPRRLCEGEISETEVMRKIINKVLTSNPKLRLESFVQPIRKCTEGMTLVVMRIQTGGNESISSLEYSTGPDLEWRGWGSEQELLEQWIKSLEMVSSARGENCPGVVLLSMESEGVLALLVSRLEHYQLIPNFLSAVSLLGEKT